jgi:threonine/homoserine/homoserine lactone efflux protein
MSGLLAEIVPIALAIAASPFPIIPAILLLFTARPRATALAFLVGWAVGILLATLLFVLLTNVVQLGDEPPSWASWARIVLGLALVALGLSRWRGRDERRDTPAWMAALDRATPGSALRLGLLLSAANPKILILAAAGGLAIGAADVPSTETAAAVAVFTAIGAVTVALPVLLYLVLGERMLTPLGRARDWLDEHNAAVMAVVITAIGVFLAVEGYRGLP